MYSLNDFEILLLLKQLFSNAVIMRFNDTGMAKSVSTNHTAPRGKD